MDGDRTRRMCWRSYEDLNAVHHAAMTLRRCSIAGLRRVRPGLERIPRDVRAPAG